jgi:hypothetical protein
MGTSAPVGPAVNWLARILAAALVLCVVPTLAGAQDRSAVLVFGAPGGETYAATYGKWEDALVESLRNRLAFAPERITVLSGRSPDASLRSTEANVRRVFAGLRSGGADDVVLVVLIGHGTLDAGTAKFNLVGPDLDAGEWAALIEQVPGRLVFVNATGASFPFLEQVSGRNRIVVTATDSTAQRFDTVFPDLFVKAMEDPATDQDRNGRLSLYEVFTATSGGVRQHYEQRGQLATERALLDDNGDRVGREAGAPGQDGALARTTYLDADPVNAATDPEVAALLTRQRSLEEQAEALKLRKPSMPAAVWEAQFEKLMIELARVSRAIRSRS